MVKPTKVPSIVHWEGTDLVVMTRVEDAEGDNILQSDLTSVTLHVFERVTGTRIGVATTLVIANTVFNTLQTDNAWDADTVGYNFRTVISGDFFPDGDETYRVEIVANPVNGSDFLMAAVDVESQNRFSD